jgi:hypothetical protein
MLNVCLARLEIIDMKINPNKSLCIRIGVRHDKPCAFLNTPFGPIPQGTELKYLGVIILAGKKLKFNQNLNKSKFYRSLNGILGTLGTNCEPGVLLALIDSHCTPCLLYGMHIMSLTKSELASIEHPYSRAFMKVFRTFDMDVVRSCQYFSGFLDIEHRLAILKRNFLCSVGSSKNNTVSRLLHDVLLKISHDGELDNIDKVFNIDINDSTAIIKAKVWTHFEASLR